MKPGPPGLVTTLPRVGIPNRDLDPFEQRKISLLSMVEEEKPMVTYQGERMSAEEMTLRMANSRRMGMDDYNHALQAVGHMAPEALMAIQRKLEKFHAERDAEGSGGMPTGFDDPLKSTGVFSNLQSTMGSKAPDTFFAAADADKDGTLSPRELRNALARRNVQVTNEELFRIMALYDKNGDGKISIPEYLEGVNGGGPRAGGHEGSRSGSRVEDRPRMVGSAVLRQDQLGRRGHSTTLGKQRSLVQEKVNQRFADAAGVRKFRAAMRMAAAESSVDINAQPHRYGSRLPFKMNLHTFEVALRMLNLQLDKPALKVLFDSYDFDKKGTLDVDEFLDSVTR